AIPAGGRGAGAHRHRGGAATARSVGGRRDRPSFDGGRCRRVAAVEAMTAEPSRKDFALHRGFAPPSPKGITHGLDSPARLLPVLLAVPPAPGPTPGRRRFAAGGTGPDRC